MRFLLYYSGHEHRIKDGSGTEEGENETVYKMLLGSFLTYTFLF